MRKLIALLAALVLVACNHAVSNETEPDSCEVENAARMPAGCWEDPSCTIDPDAEERCSRAFVCEIERPDGSVETSCKTAQDCTCLSDLASECGEDPEWPEFCRRDQ
ncbi:MAG: hypothetical protein HOW73_32940 [Polyangiaceae bacterium]|nr:hypothetical protein [Polyangiaceae bacterium]